MVVSEAEVCSIDEISTTCYGVGFCCTTFWVGALFNFLVYTLLWTLDCTAHSYYSYFTMEIPLPPECIRLDPELRDNPEDGILITLLKRNYVERSVRVNVLRLDPR